MRELILAIEQKHKESGITLNVPASADEIQNFERKVGFQLPPDFREFYLVCNGFSCEADLFNMISLKNALQYKEDYGKGWFRFAEYMIYSDSWTLRMKDAGIYEIVYSEKPGITLTNSLHKFLERFLRGNMFDNGGLYDWEKEVAQN